MKLTRPVQWWAWMLDEVRVEGKLVHFHGTSDMNPQGGRGTMSLDSPDPSLANELIEIMKRYGEESTDRIPGRDYTIEALF